MVRQNVWRIAIRLKMRIRQTLWRILLLKRVEAVPLIFKMEK